jgi:hypothetical protein
MATVGAELRSASNKERKIPKVMEHMRVTPAENGGAVVEHHFTSYEHKPESHVFGPNDAADFTDHMLKHAGFETGGEIADKAAGGAEADSEMKK